MTELIIFTVSLLSALTCALLGNFLVLRKMSLMGDAISHAVLPGIVCAYLLVGGLESPLFFVLAVSFGLLLTFFVQMINEKVKISSESIIGIVFTFLFALGVILLVQFANNVHLDQDAVLFGHVEFSAWRKLIVAGVDLGPRSLWTMAGTLLFNVLIISLFYKELKLSTFDPGFAHSVGISTKKIHYLLMLMTSVTVVAAFEVLGSILVVALLVVPSASAYILAKNLSSMIVLSLVFAFLAVLFGFSFALSLDASISASIAVFSGLILFLIAVSRFLVLRRKDRRQRVQLERSN